MTMHGAGTHERATTAADVIRSLAFYGVFYLGTIGYVLATILGLGLGHRPLMAIARGWSRYHRACMRVLLGIRIEVTGPQPTGHVVIALKHESFAEAIDLPALLKAPVVFAKAELLRMPLWGKAARIYGLVPVERDQGASALRAMVTAARAAVAKGRLLAIFPEGTRVPTGQKPPLQAGFAGLYKLMGLAVVPVAVNSGRLYHRTWKRPGTITMAFGEAIPAGLPRAEIEARVQAAINLLNP